MSKKRYDIIILVSFSLLITSCGTAVLKDNEFLYTGATLKIESNTLSKKEKKALRSVLENDLYPKPNTTILGLRPQLFIGNLVGTVNQQKGFKSWVKRKFGEEPVLLKQVDRDFNKKLLVNHAENKGFFNAKARYELKKKSKTAKVIYTVTPGQQYNIRNVQFDLKNSPLDSAILKTAQHSLLKTNHPFDLDALKSERKRIDARLKENGFYYFHPNNLIIEADSTVSDNSSVDLTIQLKQSTPNLAKKPFRIGKVVVFSDYDINQSRSGAYPIPYNTDSLKVFDDMYIVDPKKQFKPKIFKNTLQFDIGDLYNRKAHNRTLNRLSSLGVYKFVKNEFIVSDSIHNKLDVYYQLTPRDMQSLRIETTAKSNSADFFGSEVNINWTHRNLFKGAEQFRFSIYGALDLQFVGQQPVNNIYRVGTNATLSIPRFIVPFSIQRPGAFIPRTQVAIGYEFLQKTKQYALHNFTTSFGYLWKENIRKEHDLKVLDVVLAYPQHISESYKKGMAKNPALKKAVEDQLIYGPTYSYKYTNTMLPLKNTVYYKGTLDLAGSLTGLLTGADAQNNRRKKVFDIPFSQYAKIEQDVRLYHHVSKKQSIATRLIAGIAYPYGNSTDIPFSKQFFSGGSNSVRAFRARTLGPGSFQPSKQQDSYLLDQGGDIRLEFNTEYRLHVWRFLNAAAFVDAGNVWLIHADKERVGGEFSKDWYKEIAVGGGMGLRLDFDILVLRLDVAMPIRVPYLQEGNRWMYDKIKLGSSTWRYDNLMFNIAIGYPF